MIKIKIQAKGSKKNIMFVSKISERAQPIIDIFNLNEQFAVFLENDIDFEITEATLVQLIKRVKNEIEKLLNSDEFVVKEIGHTVELNGKDICLNTKSYKIDRTITSLNSLLKIALYSKSHGVPLSLEHFEK